MNNAVNVYDKIAPAFWDVHDDIRDSKHSEYWFKGGRGSTKSSFISIEIVLGLLRDNLANALIYRRVGNTIRDSVYAQIVWAINELGLARYFKCRTVPPEIVYIPTGQKIMFRGADDPMKSKSIKLAKGYFKYLWFEELAEFTGMESIRTIKQSALRGVDTAFTMYSYNPPKSASAWVNEEALSVTPNRLVHHSTYLDVPPEWLGLAIIEQAESLRLTNERAYRNEFLGEVTGSGGNVFENIEIREVTKADMDTLQWFYQGIDWGFFPDPFQWVRCAYEPRRKELYIIDEYRANKAGNAEVFEAIKEKLSPTEQLTADSAEPKSIGDFKDYGASWIKGVIKGAGSVDYSVKWLASLSKIIIDPKCRDTAHEFVSYEYQRNNEGKFINGYVDANNHCIDATRYAMFPVWKRKGM